VYRGSYCIYIYIYISLYYIVAANDGSLAPVQCTWCSANQFQDKTTGSCQAATVCASGSAARGAGSCDIVVAVLAYVRIIIIVVVVVHVINLAAITFAAHKTVRGSPFAPPPHTSSP
jgi:hypothetical protein